MSFPTAQLTPSRLANLSARAIFQAFEAYTAQFKTITQRARQHFERRDWAGNQADAVERLELYKKIVTQIEADIRNLLEDRTDDKLVWVSMKAVYSGLIDEHDNWELAETFFNSITRRIFDTVGVDPRIEFVASDFDVPPTRSRYPVYRTYGRTETAEALIHAILNGYQFQAPFEDLTRDVEAVAATLRTHLSDIGALRFVEHTEMIEAVFYRGMGAYLVGRLFSGSHQIPMALALHHTPGGIVVDAVLLDENDISVLFSFTHSYFHVDVERPYDLVNFLKTIIPRKRVAELYISIGHNKHGKTALYRDLLRHLAYSDDTFEVARGQRGLVMAVFTMPSYNVVFKVIKDRFGAPKNTTRRAIMSKYDLVFKHDRAGRLVDAQEFEHLKIDRQRFSDELLSELLETAGRTVHVEGDQVVIEHVYVERRVIPLNIYVREADEAAAQAAVVDYGRAIKDLAVSNIFPGDLLHKNFGVTRHGRVVFYDYDELTLMTTCNFREIPQAPGFEEEMAAEPWFYVGEHDIFPEEFVSFLSFPGALQAVFMAQHANLFEAAFWQQTQAHIKAGRMIHILPYTEDRQLPHRRGQATLYEEIPDNGEW